MDDHFCILLVLLLPNKKNTFGLIFHGFGG